MTSLSTTPFDKLSAHGLITDDQREAVLAHPDYATFAALAQPHQQLLWAYRQGLISHQELDAMVTIGQSERDDILDAVNDQIADDISAHHRHLLDQLLTLELITAEQRSQLTEHDHAWRIASISDMLLTLCKDGIVTAPHMLALRARVDAQKHLIDGARRRQIVEEVYARLEADPDYAEQIRMQTAAGPSEATVLFFSAVCYYLLTTQEWLALTICTLGVWITGGHRGLVNLLFCTLAWTTLTWPPSR